MRRAATRANGLLVSPWGRARSRGTWPRCQPKWGGQAWPHAGLARANDRRCSTGSGGCPRPWPSRRPAAKSSSSPDASTTGKSTHARGRLGPAAGPTGSSGATTRPSLQQRVASSRAATPSGARKARWAAAPWRARTYRAAHERQCRIWPTSAERASDVEARYQGCVALGTVHRGVLGKRRRPGVVIGGGGGVHGRSSSPWYPRAPQASCTPSRLWCTAAGIWCQKFCRPFCTP